MIVIYLTLGFAAGFFACALVTIAKQADAAILEISQLADPRGGQLLPPQGFIGPLIAREFSQEECRDGEARARLES